MTRFTDDNTDGYSADQLAELNRLFAAAVAAEEARIERELDPTDTFDGSTLDAIAEQVERELTF